MLQGRSVLKEIRKYSDPKHAEASKWFFKTGKGEYGEGDVFAGLSVPDSRKIARKYIDISFDDVAMLLASKVHEARLIALIILNEKFRKGDATERKNIVDFYLRHTKYVNNWDLVDTSAHKILGAWLLDKKDRKIINKLARSKYLWEERIAVVATFPMIAKKDFSLSLQLAEQFMDHQHDLIHKAVGWMLREVGKKDLNVLRKFLKKYKNHMPRTMLRYSIEKFSEKERKKYMTKG